MGNNNFTYEQETQELITLARSGTHEKIIRFLQNERKGKLLDASAGTGILLVLAKEGKGEILVKGNTF